MCILQISRNLQIPALLYFFHRLEDSCRTCIRLRRSRYIDRSLGQDDLSLRHADPFHCFCSTDRNLERPRVSSSAFFCCRNHDSPGNESHIFPDRKQPCQIIQRRIRVRTAHAFDERRNRIVMIVAILVITDVLLLNAFFCHCKRDMHIAIVCPVCCHHRQFQCA